MVDREKIEGMIRHLRQYATYLQEIVAQDQQMVLDDPKSIGSARYYLQVSIETCNGIANHIIATERLRAPKDYRDSFEVLSEAGILPDDFAPPGGCRRSQTALPRRNGLLVAQTSRRRC